MLSLNIPSRKLFRLIQKVAAMGNWWLAASSQQHTHPCTMSLAKNFGETSNHPGNSAPLQPSFGTLRLLAFSKLNHLWKGRDFRPLMILRKIRWGTWWWLGKLWGPKVPPLKGTEASLPYVQCFLYLSSSINASIFHITLLDTSWTDLIHVLYAFFHMYQYLHNFQPQYVQ